jgi:hypothetical protein
MVRCLCTEMKKSQLRVVGITLIAGPILLGIIIQFFGSGLITTSSPPIPPKLTQQLPPGVTIGNYTETHYHTWLFALLLMVIGGLLCLFLGRRKDQAEPNGLSQ